MKTGKGPGLSEVSLELVAASRGVGFYVMAEICQSYKDFEWALSIVLSIFKGKGDKGSCIAQLL